MVRLEGIFGGYTWGKLFNDVWNHGEWYASKTPSGALEVRNMFFGVFNCLEGDFETYHLNAVETLNTKSHLERAFEG